MSDSMQDDLYKCANRKCKHLYKHKDAVFVLQKRPGPKTLPTYRGTCPKCGCQTFHMAKETDEPKIKNEAKHENNNTTNNKAE